MSCAIISLSSTRAKKVSSNEGNFNCKIIKMKRGFLCTILCSRSTHICSTSEFGKGEKTEYKNQQLSRDYRQQQHYKCHILTVVNSKRVFLHPFSLISLLLTGAHRSLWRYTVSGNYLFLVNKATQRNHQFLLNTYQTKSRSHSNCHPPPLTVKVFSAPKDHAFTKII